MYKTGTTSIGYALQVLGYRTTYNYWGLSGMDDWLEDKSTYKQFYDIVKDKAKYFDAFSDAPWLFLYEELDEWFPNSKFILTLRSTPEAVARSDINMWRRDGAKEEDIPSSEKFINRYLKHNQEVRKYFKNRPNDLLEVCFEKGDGWEEVCNFLEKSYPGIPFPHANRGSW
jgi:hypothetical protein